MYDGNTRPKVDLVVLVFGHFQQLIKSLRIVLVAANVRCSLCDCISDVVIVAECSTCSCDAMFFSQRAWNTHMNGS